MLVFLLSTVLVVTGIIAVTKYLKGNEKKPIFGIYKQPGKWFWLKYLVFQTFLRLRQVRKKCMEELQSDKCQIQKKLEQMEQAQPLSHHPDAFDAVFFIAANKDGYYFIMGSERRHHGIINGLCYLLVPGRGLLCSRKIPDTVLFGAGDQKFGAEGILMTPVQPMKHWRLQYKGKMFPLSDPSQEVEVLLEVDWTSQLPHFNFDTDLHPSAVARSIAREDWTEQYFNNLKEAHQTHYEQMGSVTGRVQIYSSQGTNSEIHPLEMSAFRDHSYGMKRDWNLMHRYAFHMIFLEDGTSASIGVICQPCTGSMLQAGFVCTAKGEVQPVEWCNLQLYQHGEDGIPPTDYAFQFKAGGRTYTVKANVVTQSIHYVGWKWEARMVERFLRYVVDGVPGRGVSEFHYHNSGGRPDDVTHNDPQWFARVKRK